VVRDDNGMTSGWADVGTESEAGELVTHPFGGALAIAAVIGRGADRRDTEQVE
jgi:hypothetical protein